MSKKTVSIKGMTLGDFLNDVREDQTTRIQDFHGKKKAYGATVLTIHPAVYSEPIFQKKDIDDLMKAAPKIPSGKVTMIRYDKNQVPSQVPMNRRQALFELLNRAVWNYTQGKANDPIALGKLRKEIRKIIRSPKTSINYLCSTSELFQLYFSHLIKRTGDPDNKNEQISVVLLEQLQALENGLTKVISEKERLRLNQKKSKNKGDSHFLSLIDSLCKIWVGIFERDTGTSNIHKIAIEEVEGENVEMDKQVPGGPFLKFVKAVLRKAKIKKSEGTIISEIRKWKRRHLVGG